MIDDLFQCKMLVVSESAPDRELLRQAALLASCPVEFSALDSAGEPAAARELLSRGGFDVVFFDLRSSKQARKLLLDAIRAAPSRPLAILIGPAVIKTREVLTDGLEVDGTLAKPLDVREVQERLDACIRARLPRRALIVDASSGVRSIIRKVLQASRFRLEAEEAETGAAAVALASTRRFDILFVDYEMPEIDGFEVLAEFRRSSPGTGVVMITGLRDARIEDRASAEGAKGFLYKPFFAKDIDAVLNRVLLSGALTKS